MKKLILILFVFLCFQNTFAQSYETIRAAAGRFVKFTSLIDENDELFGYVELRELDNISKTEVKFGYSILDKNMNVMVSGDFTCSKIEGYNFINNYQIKYNNGHVIFGFYEKFGSTPLKCFYKIINIESNKIIAKGVYDSDIANLKRLKTMRSMRYYNAIPLTNIGFFIQGNPTLLTQPFGLKSDSYAIDFKGKKIWDLKIKKAEEKHEYEYNFLDIDESIISLIATKTRNTKKVSDHLLILDVKTGKEVSFTDLFSEDYTMRFSYSKLDENKLTIIGNYFEKDRRDYVNDKESLGLYKREIDIKSGKILKDIFMPFSKFKLSNISENGKIKGDGYLEFQKIDLNPDGSYFVVAETFKKEFVNFKTYSELYVFLLDKDLNPITVKFYDTKISADRKFSFSQKLLNDAGKVYFFYDKDENKKLEINLINFNYASKEISLSKMNVNNEESEIAVFPAKTGYITIKEFFPGASKKDIGKVDIRLEKLNYERE
jgi:hypothetical protein